MRRVNPQFPIVERPVDDRAVPVVLSLPHSGVIIPDDARRDYAVDVESVTRFGDLFVDQLYRGAVDQGVTVVRTPYSRFLVDLNRLADDLSPIAAAGASVKSDPGYHGARGVLWGITPSGRAMYHRPLAKEVVQYRLERWYHPYHDALREHLQRLRDRFGYAILIDGHSMPSFSSGIRTLPRADIVPGDLLGESCAESLTDFVCDFWARQGKSVQPNRPYRGGAITRMHGDPAAGIHAFQIEINRALYMNERTYRLNKSFSQTREECSAFLAELTRFRPDEGALSSALREGDHELPRSRR